MDTSEFDNQLERLEAEKGRLRLTIELAWRSVESLEQTVLSAERLNRGQLSSEQEAWIRATVRSRDQLFLDSLYLDLERVSKQISSLAHPSNNERRSQESEA
jgi:hypothetical protein